MNVSNITRVRSPEEEIMRKKFLVTATTMAMTLMTITGCGASDASAKTTAESTSSEEDSVEPASEDTASEEKTDDAEGGLYDGKVILGHSSWIGYAPLNVADELGLFEKHGVDVDIQSFESKSDSRAALAAGRIQGMSTTVDTQVMSAAQGLDIQIVLAEDTSDGGDGLSAKSEFTDIPSLKGHTVALDTSGGASYFWFQYLLKENDMTLDDVEAVNMSSGDAGAAFVAGEVDAAVTWESWLSRAKEAEGGAVLVDSSATPGIIVDALAMDTKFAEQYPDTVKGIIEAWYDAVDLIKTNPDEAYPIMMNFTGDETVEALEGELEGVTFYDRDGNKAYFGGDIQKIAGMAADLWVETGLIESAPDMDSMINDSFIDGLE